MVSYLYNVGEHINGYKILSQTRYKNRKGYEVLCEKHNYKNIISESNLKSGQSCPICSKKKVVKGINDINFLRPDLTKYFVNINETYTNGIGSHKYVSIKCPYCGNIQPKKIKISNLVNFGMSCKYCSDGISFGNKFMFSILSYLFGEDLECEKKFNWSIEDNNYKLYDFYIPSKSTIIEVNGIQHYSKSGFAKMGGRTLEEEQKNEVYKKELALKNGINIYVEIENKYNEVDNIKNQLFDKFICKLDHHYIDKFNSIDWDNLLKISLKSNIIKVIETWNMNSCKTTKEISNMLNIDKSTVIKYLKTGTELGLCYYNAELEKDKSNKRSKKGIKVLCSLNGEEKIFESCQQASKFYHLGKNQILRILKSNKPFATNYTRLKHLEGLIVIKLTDNQTVKQIGKTE